MTETPPHRPDSHPDSDPEHGPVVSPQRARQGRPGVRILLILIVSLSLIVLLYMLLWGGTREGMSELETSVDAREAAEPFAGDASGPPPPADGVQPTSPE